MCYGRVLYVSRAARPRASNFLLAQAMTSSRFQQRKPFGVKEVRFRYGTGKVRHLCGVHAIGIPNCDGVLHDVNHHVVDAIFKELVVE